MSIELGSFWLIKDSGCIAIVRSIIGKSNGGLTVVYTVTDNSGISSYRMSCEYELFTNIAEKFITKSELKDELNKEYVKGKTDGYNEGYQHGFTLAKEKITELDEKDNKQVYNDGYVKGHNDCSEELHSHMSEKKLEYKKQGFEDGYNTAIKEMSNSQALGEDIGHVFGTDDCCEHHNPSKETQEAMQEVLNKNSNEFGGIIILDFGAIDEGYKREIYPVTEGIDVIKFIKDNFDNIKSFTQVGDLASIEMFDKNNSGGNEQLEKELALVEKYPHYYKDIRHLNILDIYRFFDLFEVTDPCIQHSVKKLAVGGKRGAKDYEKDIKEAMDTLKRWEYMQEENKRGEGLDD